MSPDNKEVSPIYELSEKAMTFSKNKEIIYPDQYEKYAIWSFGYDLVNRIDQVEANAITKVVVSFIDYITGIAIGSSNIVIPSFTNTFNIANPDTPISNLSYNQILTYNNLDVPDFISFTVLEVECSIWLSDNAFKTFYPDYELNIVFPFDDFSSKVGSLQTMLTSLDETTPIDINDRLEEDKNGYPPTYTRLLNVPYRLPNTTTDRPCYFGFNIYGEQGNYDHVLKLKLYDYLVTEVGMSSTLVEERFPSILEVNEFFIVPRWGDMAIEESLGKSGIRSHLTRLFPDRFDLDRLVSVITDVDFLKSNSYNVPSVYNNMMITYVNGFHTDEDIKDFHEYYSDIITVSTTHPDFSRMSERTQRFMYMLESMLRTGDVSNQAQLFSRVVSNQEYKFGIITRSGVTYLSLYFGSHQYYLLPRYVYQSIIN